MRELKRKGNKLLERVYNGEQNFEYNELSVLACEYDKFDLIEGDDNRWTKDMSTILKIDDKYFRIDWSCALTENQDSEFHSQPYEVNLEQKKVTIINNIYTNK